MPYGNRYSSPHPLHNALNQLTRYLLAPLLSSAILTLAFPDFDFSMLAWVGLTPMLVALLNRKPAAAFFSAYLFGALYFAFVFTWMFTVPKYVFVHHVFLAFYLGFYIALFGLAFNLIGRYHGAMAALIAAPAIWAAGEFARANMGFLSHPGAFLAHTQYRNIPLIQLTSLTGVYGVSSMVVLVNAALTAALMQWKNRLKMSVPPALHTARRKPAMVLICVCVCLLLAVIVYGHTLIRSPLTGRAYSIALVQANIEQDRKWDPQYARWIMQAYEEMTLIAAEQDPDLIVWPEAATPGAITQNLFLFKEVFRITRKAGVYLLMGSTSHNKYKEAIKNKTLKFKNSAFLLPPERMTPQPQRYDKIHLLPFGEYLPQKSVIPWHLIHVPDMGNFIPGDKYLVFDHPKFRFSTIICWEGIFPHLARRFVKNGAQFLINITNEGWFGESAGPYHFLIMSLFRAVENRTYLVRCANTGVSCVIDPHGRIVNRVADETGDDIFVKGILTEKIIPTDGGTFYTRYGDVFAYGCIGLTAALMITGIVKSRKR